jgi:hypothetical protein
MPSAPAAAGGSPSGTRLPLSAIALSALVLGAVLAGCWAFFRHPVPPEVVLTGPWSIRGTPIAAPFEVRFLDTILDGGSMQFLIKDGQGKITVVMCLWERGASAYQRLVFYPVVPFPDGPEPEPLEITDDSDLVRNVLFHAMAHRDFHGRAPEWLNAHQLYPSRFDRLRFWLRDPR